MTPEGTARRLPRKLFALFLCHQPGGHLEFLPKLAQVPVSSAINQEYKYVNVINYKPNQEYRQEYGVSSQEAQDQPERFFPCPAQE